LEGIQERQSASKINNLVGLISAHIGYRWEIIWETKWPRNIHLV